MIHPKLTNPSGKRFIAEYISQRLDDGIRFARLARDAFDQGWNNAGNKYASSARDIDEIVSALIPEVGSIPALGLTIRNRRVEFESLLSTMSKHLEQKPQRQYSGLGRESQAESEKVSEEKKPEA